MLLFATNIILIELLLRSSIDVASSSAPITAPAPVDRSRRQLPTNDIHPRSFPYDLDCSNPSTLPGRIAAEQAATVSLCVDFTSSYAAHTRNLSYPQQTRLQQWIDDFAAASSAVNDLQESSSACVHQKSAGNSEETSAVISARADDEVVFGVQVGCGTSMVTAPADCAYGAGSLFISDFQLQSTVYTVCAATRANELVITTPNVNNADQVSSAAGASASMILVSEQL